MSWKAYLEPRPEWAGHRLYIMREDHLGRGIVTNIKLKKIGIEPVITENDPIAPEEARDFLQAMLDCAWEAGMRPLRFSDHTNELTAVRYHLEDMRKLVKLK